MIHAYLIYDRSYDMPLCLICENCKKEFTTRKRGNRVIRFCSMSCSGEFLDPIKKEYWANVHDQWKNEPRESFLEEMRGSFEKFFKKTEGCWMWQGTKKSNKKLPYGEFTFRLFSNIGAHRASWFIYKGEIPEGSLVLHKCDVPQCVNPDHLWLGNHLDNERDKISKGRGKCEKLSVEKVKELKSLMRADFGDMNLARKYGVSYQTIWHIRIGRTWKDIN